MQTPLMMIKKIVYKDRMISNLELPFNLFLDLNLDKQHKDSHNGNIHANSKICLTKKWFNSKNKFTKKQIVNLKQK